MSFKFDFKKELRSAEIDVPAKLLNDCNHLSISVSQSDGGYNNFDGKHSAKGIYLFVKPIQIDGTSRIMRLLGSNSESGYKILLEPINRYSAKKLQTIADEIEPMIQEITDLFVAGKHNEIYQLVTTKKAA